MEKAYSLNMSVGICAYDQGCGGKISMGKPHYCYSCFYFQS